MKVWFSLEGTSRGTVWKECVAREKGKQIQALNFPTLECSTKAQNRAYEHSDPLNATRPQTLLAFELSYLFTRHNFLPWRLRTHGESLGLGIRLICNSLRKCDFCRQYRKPRKSMMMLTRTTWKTQWGRSTVPSIATTWLWVLLHLNTSLHCSTVTLPIRIQNSSLWGMEK